MAINSLFEFGTRDKDSSPALAAARTIPKEAISADLPRQSYAVFW
jgi:hypothetical protein